MTMRVVIGVIWTAAVVAGRLARSPRHPARKDDRRGDLAFTPVNRTHRPV